MKAFAHINDLGDGQYSLVADANIETTVHVLAAALAGIALRSGHFRGETPLVFRFNDERASPVAFDIAPSDQVPA